MQFDPEKITFFARTDARGKNVAFGIKARDRQRHVYVIGKTGMGKSTLLENMAVQDIQNGEGMAFIDPHGSAAETLLNYIPEHRIKDVLYFAPADASHPISFNIMEDVGPDKRHLVVSGLMSVFKKIWVDAWSARMEYILQNTILALLEYPGSTLVGVNRMLSDKDYRKLVVDNVKDPSVRSFWVDEFAKYNERYMQEAGDAIKNKIGQFTANPIIRNIIGQPKSSFDIRQMMDDQKIIIMNLSKGLIGESNANLLGSMLTTRIYLAAMSRADLPPEKMKKMPNFYFYVDEFQSFANSTFANILSEARKYHLNLTIAHQYIEQMEEDVRSAVFGNVGTIISFRVGPFDAEVLETIFTPQFLATDIVNLGFAQVYLTLMIDGIGSPPFSATTLPPIAPQVVSYKDVVVGASRMTYARPRADVEVDIVKFHEPVVLPRVERAPRPERVEEGMRTPPRSYSNGNGNGGSNREGRERTERPRERSEQSSRPRESTSHVPTSAPADTTSPNRVSPPPLANHEHRPRPGEESREHHVPQGNHMVRRDQPKKNPETHLTELRSLLRKVVDDEKGKEEPRQNDGGKQVQQEKREVSPQTQSQATAPREVRSDSVPNNGIQGAQSHQMSVPPSREHRESVPVASVERDEKERAKQSLREKVSLLTDWSTGEYFSKRTGEDDEGDRKR
jgi:energy-coupling factor transporter ATP-binding protein EcfA2